LREAAAAPIEPEVQTPETQTQGPEVSPPLPDTFDGSEDEAGLLPAPPEDERLEAALFEADQPDDILPEDLEMVPEVSRMDATETLPSEEPQQEIQGPAELDAFHKPQTARHTPVDTEFDEEYEAPTPPPNQTARRTIDHDLLAVLREEAQREVQARKAEGSALETQPDLGLVEAKPAPSVVERDTRPTESEDVPDESVPRITRRDLLPDIEEINSTLRATSERNQSIDNDPALDRAKNSGFGGGFGAVMVLMAIGLGVYLGAAKLAEAVPEAAPALESYVAGIDSARLWLDAKMNEIIQSMRGPSEG
jgi:hypothetical protein